MFIDSRGGSTLHAEIIRRLLTAPDQNGSPACRIITAVTGRAASAAADLLSFGDYAVAYPESSVFYHGVRYTVDDPITLERASEYGESLRYRNDLFAMSLARRCVSRFVFRYAMSQHLFQDYRNRSGNQVLQDLQCFEGVVSEKLSTSASKALGQARKRYDHYQYLVNRVLARAAKFKKFRQPKRAADFEEVILREVIGAVAARNKDGLWTFQGDGGLLQLNDDFLLLLEYMSCYDGNDLQRACGRWGTFFLSLQQQAELKGIEDETARQKKKLEMLKEPIRPLWLFFVALCHALQEGEENDLTATDAAWLGLIDEVIGSNEPVSVRSLMEWEPDPAPPPNADQPITLAAVQR